MDTWTLREGSRPPFFQVEHEGRLQSPKEGGSTQYYKSDDID
jgi:hypothetical protein